MKTTKVCLGLSLFVLTAADAQAQCQRIADLVAQLRPEPVEIYITREFVPISFAELVAKADLVLEATVKRSRVYVGEDECYLYTNFLIQPLAFVFGGVPVADRPGQKPLILRQRGGETTIDGVKVIVRDEQLPPLSDGAHVMLFLTQGAKGRYELVGSILGAFEVTPDSRLRSLVREQNAFSEVAAMSKSEVAGEVRRIKSR